MKIAESILIVSSYRHGGGKFGDRYGLLSILCLWGIAGVLVWCGADRLDRGRRLGGWLLISIGVLCDALGCAIGCIGCMPWDWWRCLHDGQQHSLFSHGAREIAYMLGIWCR